MTARKRIWSLAVGVIALGAWLLPSQAGAQSPAKSPALGLSLSAGYIFPSNPTHHSHLGGSGALLIVMSPNLALEVGGAFSIVPTQGQALGLSQGRLFHIPLLLNVRFRLPLRSIPLVPFLTAGGGYALNFMNLDADMVKNYEILGFEVSETCQSSGLLQAGGGLECWLSPGLSLEAFGLYRFSQASVEWSITDTVSGLRSSGTAEKVSLNAAVAGLGLRFIF